MVSKCDHELSVYTGDVPHTTSRCLRMFRGINLIFQVETRVVRCLKVTFFLAYYALSGLTNDLTLSVPN